MMGKSTFISAALHAAILLFALVAFPAAKMDSAPLIAVPVDLATPADLTKIKAGTKDAPDDAALAGKPKEKKDEAVRELEAEKPPVETAAAEEKPKPEPKPEEKKPEPKAEEKKPEPKPKAEAKEAAPKPEPKKEAAKKPEETPAKPKVAATKPQPKTKRDFNADRIAALLNKIPDADDEPAPVLPSDEPQPKKVRGQSNGTEMTMSVNEIDALRARIAQCWSPPPGGLGAEQIVVKLRLKLNEDGTLVGYPTVANSGSSPFFQAAADSAVRAVYQCQPYTLPSDKYAQWRDMILNFDPSDMYRAG
jgi:colicin import membrane protein